MPIDAPPIPPPTRRALRLLSVAYFVQAVGALAVAGALVPWAFATDILWPSQQRRIVELLPQRRGIGLALTASFMFCGIGAGAAIAGHVYPAFGFAGLLLSAGVLFSLSVASLAVSQHARQRAPLVLAA